MASTKERISRTPRVAEVVTFTVRLARPTVERLDRRAYNAGRSRNAQIEHELAAKPTIEGFEQPGRIPFIGKKEPTGEDQP